MACTAMQMQASHKIGGHSVGMRSQANNLSCKASSRCGRQATAMYVSVCSHAASASQVMLPSRPFRRSQLRPLRASETEPSTAARPKVPSTAPSKGSSSPPSGGGDDSSSEDEEPTSKPASSNSSSSSSSGAQLLSTNGNPPTSNPINATSSSIPTSNSALAAADATPRQSSVNRTNTSAGGSASSLSSPSEDEKFSWQEFVSSELPSKLAVLVGLIAFSRLGVYIRLPGVDVDAFANTMKGSGLLGYVDALSGGSISKVGLFSLGIIPYINASIVLQLFSAAFPGLKKMQREDGAQGRAKFQYYQKLTAFAFAIVQAIGQLSYIKPFVNDFSPLWLAGNTCGLVAGAMAMVYVADTISELKLGNGTSVIIFANIASALPASIGQLVAQNAENDPTNIAIFAIAFFATTLGIIYVQEAERRIPVNYSSRYTAGNLARQSYLPFKVNATGVMPLIFASSLLALPTALARYTDSPLLGDVAKQLGPGGVAYLPFNVALIVFFNYYYTFLQLEPKELAEQLKKSGAAIPAIRPGKQTAEYVSETLTRMSILGSVFLGALSVAPAAVEGLTHLTAFRGFAGTSVLIMVGVATDTARRIRAEQSMAKYQDVDKLYDNMKL